MKILKKLLIGGALAIALVLSPHSTQAADVAQQQIDLLKEQVLALQLQLSQLLAQKNGTAPVATTTPKLTAPAAIPMDGVIFRLASSSQITVTAASTTARQPQNLMGRTAAQYLCTIPAGKSTCQVNFEYDVSSTTEKWRYITINRETSVLVKYLGRPYSEPKIGNNFPKKGVLQYELAYNRDARKNLYGFSMNLELENSKSRATRSYGHSVITVECAPGTKWSGKQCQTSSLEIARGVVDEAIDPLLRTTSNMTSRKVCYIPLGGSTCRVSVVWQFGDAELGEEGTGNLILSSGRTNPTNPQFATEFKVVSTLGSGDKEFELSGPGGYQFHLSEESPSKDGYANGIIFLESSAHFAAKCRAPNVWDTTLGKCVEDKDKTTSVPEGYFTTTSPCVVAVGTSTCTIQITWGHPQTAVNPSIKVVGGAVLSTARKGDRVPYTLTYNPSGVNIGSYVGEVEFARRPVSFRCATGSAWNGSVCAVSSGQTNTQTITTSSTQDKVKPTVIIDSVSPFVSSGTSTISVTATDAEGIDNVKLYINGVLIDTDTKAPYVFNFNNRGRYSLANLTLISVIATDKSGNQTLVRTSAKVTR